MTFIKDFNIGGSFERRENKCMGLDEIEGRVLGA